MYSDGLDALGESNPPSGLRRVDRSSNTVGCPSSKSRSVTTGSTLPVVIDLCAAGLAVSPEGPERSGGAAKRLDTASPAAFRSPPPLPPSRGGPHAAVDLAACLGAAQTVDLTTWILTRPLVGVKKLLGFTSLTAMSMIVPMADCAGRARPRFAREALAGLLAPCTRAVYTRAVRARAPSTVVPAMLSVASTRTCPCVHGAKILRDHHGPW